MNERERFLRTMHFGEVDRVPYWEFSWFWDETIERWYNEGLPRDVYLEKFFHLDRPGIGELKLEIGRVPSVRTGILEETDRHKIYVDFDGITRKEFKKNPGSSMPQFLDFPVKAEEDFQKIKKYYNPASPTRYPLYWNERVKCLRERDYPLLLEVAGLFWELRQWMGPESCMLAFYDNPDFVHEMLDFWTDFIINVTQKAVQDTEVDCVVIAEDMAYKTGSFISPRLFRQFLLPHYKKMTSHFRKHGVDIILVDSDGNVNELIPLWLEGGLNGLSPLEVQAGMDAVRLRKEYGKDLLLMGNIDKIALIKGKKDAIKGEVMSKVPYLISQGGYVPSIDHSVPADVSLESYAYYLELIRGCVEKG